MSDLTIITEFFGQIPEEILTDITITLGTKLLEQFSILGEGMYNNWQRKNVYNQLKMLSDMRSKDRGGYVEAEDMDWLAYWFEISKNISDRQMQTLWTKLLDGELDSPGSYSKNSLRVLSTIKKSDADTFSRLCDFIWDTPFGRIPIIYQGTIKDSNRTYNVFGNHGINRESLQNLKEIGLIDYRQDIENIITFHRNYEISYHGEEIPMKAENANFGLVNLTSIGQELERLHSGQPVEKVVEFVYVKNYKSDT